MFLPNHFCLKHYCIFLHFCPETTHNQLIPTLRDKTTWAWCRFNICFSQSGNCVWHVVSCILSPYIKGEVGGEFHWQALRVPSSDVTNVHACGFKYPGGFVSFSCVSKFSEDCNWQMWKWLCINKYKKEAER